MHSVTMKTSTLFCPLMEIGQLNVAFHLIHSMLHACLMDGGVNRSLVSVEVSSN